MVLLHLALGQRRVGGDQPLVDGVLEQGVVDGQLVLVLGDEVGVGGALARGGVLAAKCLHRGVVHIGEGVADGFRRRVLASASQATKMVDGTWLVLFAPLVHSSSRSSVINAWHVSPRGWIVMVRRSVPDV